MTHLALLETYKQKPLFEILRDPSFPQEALESILSQILAARKQSLELMRPWMVLDQPVYKVKSYSLEELALDSLANQPREWLDELSPFFEQTFSKALIHRDKVVLSRLKTLISEAHAGVSPTFLEDLLHKPPVIYTELEELDIWLLRAKLWEHLEEIGLYIFELDELLEQRPWLLVVKIYAFREKDPYTALELLHYWDESEDYLLSPEIEDYVSVYLRHAIYNLLHDGVLENYHQFLNLTYSFQKAHIRELIKKALQHEWLQDIAKQFDQINSIVIDANIAKSKQHALASLFN